MLVNFVKGDAAVYVIKQVRILPQVTLGRGLIVESFMTVDLLDVAYQYLNRLCVRLTAIYMQRANRA